MAWLEARYRRLSARSTAVALGVLVLGAILPARAAEAPGTWLAGVLEQRVTGDHAYRHVQAWQRIADANGGNRAVDTPGFAASADYLVERLRASGYQVTRQPVPFEDHRVDVEHIEELTPDAPPVRALLAKWSPSTPAGGIEAPLAVVPTERDGAPDPTPGCEPGDYTGLDVRGTVVLVPSGGCSSEAQQQVAARLGARAYLAYQISPRPDNVFRGYLFAPDQVTIPMATITQRRAEQLAAAAADRTVRLRLELRGHRVEGVTENIFAETSGGSASDVVMAGAHLDSVREGPGINDNATSAAGLLETAIQLAPYQDRVRNKVRFGWWGAEELIDVGSIYYVDHLDQGARDDISLYLNYELIASPNFGRFVMDGDDSDHPGSGSPPGPPGSGVVEEAIAGYYRDRGIAHETVDIRTIGSDHEPFAAAGIPIGGSTGGARGIKTAEQARSYGGQAGDLYDPCYHQPCDTAGHIHRAEFNRGVRAIAWTVGRFAQDVSDLP